MKRYQCLSSLPQGCQIFSSTAEHSHRSSSVRRISWQFLSRALDAPDFESLTSRSCCKPPSLVDQSLPVSSECKTTALCFPCKEKHISIMTPVDQELKSNKPLFCSHIEMTEQSLPARPLQNYLISCSVMFPCFVALMRLVYSRLPSSILHPALTASTAASRSLVRYLNLVMM